MAEDFKHGDFEKCYVVVKHSTNRQGEPYIWNSGWLDEAQVEGVVNAFAAGDRVIGVSVMKLQDATADFPELSEKISIAIDDAVNR